jgi:hypothetical protein
MAAKTFTITAEEMETRIAHATRALSRKKFTEKQLRQYIVNGKLPTETKRTKSGYQLFLDDFRKDLSKEERANVGQVAKDGSAEWRDMDDEAKQPYLDMAAQLKEDAPADKKKTPQKKTKSKKKKTEDSDDEPDEEPQDEDTEDDAPVDDEPKKKNKKSTKGKTDKKDKKSKKKKKTED